MTGWFFDAFPVQDGMQVWFITEHGEAIRLFDPFQLCFYRRLDGDNRIDLVAITTRFRLPIAWTGTAMTELFSGQALDVTAVTVSDPMQFNRCVRTLARFLPHYAFYNSNIPLPQMYMYDRDIFPLAYCTCQKDGDGSVTWMMREDRTALTPAPRPDLRTLRLTHAHDDRPSKYNRPLVLHLGYDGRTCTIEDDHPAHALTSFADHLRRCDPDIILSSWGDALLLPRLIRDARMHHVPLPLNRDAGQPYRTTREKSYWTYGEVIHKEAATMNWPKKASKSNPVNSSNT